MDSFDRLAEKTLTEMEAQAAASPGGPAAREMKVVHLITSTTVGGAERALALLVEGGGSSTTEHIVISMTPVGAVGEELRRSGRPVYSLDMPRGRISPSALLRLRGLLRLLRPDILHCWMYHANLMGLLGARLARVPHLAWGIRCSDMALSGYSRLTRQLAVIGARLSFLPDAIVVNSDAGAQFHRKMGYNASRMVVIYNGFDLERFRADPAARQAVRQELGIGEETLLIGFVARYDPVKDHDSFFRAAGILARGREDVRFLLCGRDITRENGDIAAMVRAHSLEGRVHLLGIRDDIPRLTAALDIATSSAISEGFSNVLGEAMSCGVTCVATRVGDAEHIVGRTGRIVPPHDPPSLAAAWRELMEMGPAGRQALGRMARERIASNFSLASYCRLHELLYEAIASCARLPIPAASAP